MSEKRRRVFVAGASGLIGVRLVPLLVDAGYAVAGLTRTPAKAGRVAALGAEPIVADALDADALGDAVRAFAPDLMMQHLTDLPDDVDELSARLPAHARLLRQGTRNLVAAAAAVRVVAQSIAWEAGGETDRAYAELEATVLSAGGTVVRFGQFYGPGTYYEHELPDEPRIHIDAAARRAFEAIGCEGVVIATE
jgi:uncharacterized protein YbjT (DUF2867 family)